MKTYGSGRVHKGGRGAPRKKGLTPIIAVILLLMMTVAAAGAAFFWFIRVQGELQGGGEQFTQDLSEKVISGLEFTIGEYKVQGADNGLLTLIVKNTGQTPIPVSNGSTSPTTTWLLQDDDQDIVCNQQWDVTSDSVCLSGCDTSIPVSALHTITLNLTGTCNIASNTTYPGGSLFFTKLDFSGQVATGGSFTK